MEIYKVIKYNFSYISIEENNNNKKEIDSLQPSEKESILKYTEALKKSIGVLNKEDLSYFISGLDIAKDKHPLEELSTDLYLKTTYNIIHRYLNHTEIEINVQFIKDNLPY